MKIDKFIRYEFLFYFCSIFGYIYESILGFIDSGKIFTHGLFYGPWMPIYGIGVILISFLNKYKNKPYLIFTLSFFITGIWEYLSGFILLKIFRIRLWDYTGYFLNIGGYVCFLSALCFAIGGLLATYIIIPYVDKIIKKSKKFILVTMIMIFNILFIIDIIATILK